MSIISKINSNAGTIDYINGIISLTNFNPVDVNNEMGELTIQAIPTSTIVSSSRDKIIALDSTDSTAINVNISAKT